ncbi:MAG: hypothetical protein U0W40_13765 [Acidimicrobiia bacterium]
MKIGQISFLKMTTAAEHPYGSTETGSKYQGQRGPTPSRHGLNFRATAGRRPPAGSDVALHGGRSPGSAPTITGIVGGVAARSRTPGHRVPRR